MSWKNSARVKARKILKEAGLDKDVVLGNAEDILQGELEFGVISSRKSNDYIPTTKLYAAFATTERSGMPIRFETINEYMGVVRLVHVSERKASG